MKFNVQRSTFNVQRSHMGLLRTDNSKKAEKGRLTVIATFIVQVSSKGVHQTAYTIERLPFQEDSNSKRPYLDVNLKYEH